MGENAVVPEVLNFTNYKIWSNCMKMYLLGQDLWDIIEPEPEAEESSKTRRRKNALALHAIHMSCGKASLSTIGELESAKEAWDLLRSVNDISGQRIPDHDSDSKLEADLHHQTNIVEEHPDHSSDNEVKDEDKIDYDPFVDAVENFDWRSIKSFLDSHPEANPSHDVGAGGKTALHYMFFNGKIDIGRLLVDYTKRSQDLEILDGGGYTAFARLTVHNKPGVLKLLQHMVARNASLPNIGNPYTVPVIMASWKGFKDTTRYLYSVIDKDIFNPEHGIVGVKLVINCINIRLFDVASEIVTKFPKILQQQNNQEIYPIHALAKSFSALKSGFGHHKSRVFEVNHWVSKSWKYAGHLRRIQGEEDMFQVSDDEKHSYDRARAFLRLVCAQVSSYDRSALRTCVYAAMIEASKNGIVEFVSEMVVANANIDKAYVGNGNMFWHAVENRQEKVHSLIYSFIEQKDSLFSCQNPEKNNILHMVAILAPTAVLDRTSGPILQMQRELQWFKEIWSLAKPRYREDLNIDGLTPRALFTKTHADLIDAGERAMKDTAQSSTFIGALIFTVMFAAAFTVPGGNNSATGLPVFLTRALFRIFIVCDALSLYSSTTSVLVFLGVLTSRYAEDDFLLRLPRKLMMGLVTIFFSIITMMVSFCAALALMLDGQLRYILPTVLLAGVPIIIIMSSVLPVLLEMFVSTFGPGMFDKSGKLVRMSKEGKRVSMLDPMNIMEAKKVAGRREDEDASSNQISVDRIFATTCEYVTSAEARV